MSSSNTPLSLGTGVKPRAKARPPSHSKTPAEKERARRVAEHRAREIQAEGLAAGLPAVPLKGLEGFFDRWEKDARTNAKPRSSTERLTHIPNEMIRRTLDDVGGDFHMRPAGAAVLRAREVNIGKHKAMRK